MRYLRIGILVVFVLACALNLGATFYYNSNHDFNGPVMTCDQDTLELSVNSSYEDLFLGLKAQDEEDGDLTDQIMISGKSHFIEQGTCKVEYVVFDSDHNSATLTRMVHFTDYTSPQLVLSEPLVYSKGENIRYLDQIKAVDVLDGDISDKIKVKSSNVSKYEAGIYPVQLEVSNSFGDKVTVYLNVTVTEGDTDLSVRLKEYVTYIDVEESFDPYDLIESVKAADGSVLSRSDVHISGDVDTSQPGCYQLVYYINGSSAEQRTYLTVVVSGEDE